MQHLHSLTGNREVLHGEVPGEIAAVLEDPVVLQTGLVVHDVVEFDVTDTRLCVGADGVQETGEGAGAAEDELRGCVQVQDGVAVDGLAGAD